MKEAVVDLETLFQQNIVKARRIYKVSGKNNIDRIGFDPELLSSLRDYVQPPPSPDEVVLTTDGYFTSAIMKFEPSPATRRECFVQSNTVAPENLDVLHDLVRTRHGLSEKLGYSSYAEKTTRDKMAGSRENVLNFIARQAKETEHGYREEMEMLKRKKIEFEGRTEDIKPWDIPFYINLCKDATDAAGYDISPYLGVENCVRGLVHVTDTLLNVKMVESKIEEGEVCVSKSRSDELRKRAFFVSNDAIHTTLTQLASLVAGLVRRHEEVRVL